MTEEEWLSGENVAAMLDHVRRRVMPRKLRLLACGCCRGMWAGEPPTTATAAIEIGERGSDLGYFDVDGQPVWDELLRQGLAAQEAGDPAGALRLFHCMSCLGENPLFLFAPGADKSMREKLFGLPARVLGWFRESATYPAAEAQRSERATPCRPLMRCVFGNPFRPASFLPSWRTDTVVAFATQMYETRDFSAMPVLADALQDAGCDSGEILSHCRGHGPHVRGCFVVDLVLGKM